MPTESLTLNFCLYLSPFVDFQDCVKHSDYSYVSTTQFCLLYFDNLFYFQIKLMSSPLCFFKIMSLLVVNFTVMLDQALGLQPAYIFFPGPVPSQGLCYCFLAHLEDYLAKLWAPFTHPPLAGASLKASTKSWRDSPPRIKHSTWSTSLVEVLRMNSEVWCFSPTNVK